MLETQPLALAPVRTVQVRTHLADFTGMSAAALVQCDDGQKYVIKRGSLGRALIAEHVVGRLGVRIGAPCMEVGFAIVPGELIAADAKLGQFNGPICHASSYLPNVSEQKAVSHWDTPQNRKRFAQLQILYSWTLAGDHQFMYEVSAPHLVYSHDYGLFFPGHNNWSPITLSNASPVQLDAAFAKVGLQATEVKSAAAGLREISGDEIMESVNSIPSAWGVQAADLQTLGGFLIVRRENLLNMIDAMP